MSVVTWGLIALGVIIALLGQSYRKWRGKRLPDISDQEFLDRLSSPEDVLDREALLDVRARVAEVLDVPKKKLSPEQTLGELARTFDYFGDLRVGWGDLEFELVEIRQDAGLEKHEPWPTTVGELVVELARAGNTSQARSNHPESTEPVETE